MEKNGINYSADEDDCSRSMEDSIGDIDAYQPELKQTTREALAMVEELIHLPEFFDILGKSPGLNKFLRERLPEAQPVLPPLPPPPAPTEPSEKGDIKLVKYLQANHSKLLFAAFYANPGREVAEQRGWLETLAFGGIGPGEFTTAQYNKAAAMTSSFWRNHRHNTKNKAITVAFNRQWGPEKAPFPLRGRLDLTDYFATEGGEEQLQDWIKSEVMQVPDEFVDFTKVPRLLYNWLEGVIIKHRKQYNSFEEFTSQKKKKIREKNGNDVRSEVMKKYGGNIEESSESSESEEEEEFLRGPKKKALDKPASTRATSFVRDSKTKNGEQQVHRNHESSDDSTEQQHQNIKDSKSSKSVGANKRKMSSNMNEKNDKNLKGIEENNTNVKTAKAKKNKDSVSKSNKAKKSVTHTEKNKSEGKNDKKGTDIHEQSTSDTNSRNAQPKKKKDSEMSDKAKESVVHIEKNMSAGKIDKKSQKSHANEQGSADQRAKKDSEKNDQAKKSAHSKKTESEEKNSKKDKSSKTKEKERVQKDSESGDEADESETHKSETRKKKTADPKKKKASRESEIKLVYAEEDKTAEQAAATRKSTREKKKKDLEIKESLQFDMPASPSSKKRKISDVDVSSSPNKKRTKYMESPCEDSEE